MLQTLLPKAHRRFLSLPLLGPIMDGFDDWLAMNGFTRGSRKYSIRMLRQVDADLRLRNVREVARLTHPVLHDCWKALMKMYPCGAGTVRTLERYLIAEGLMLYGKQAAATCQTTASEQYADYLRGVRGFAVSTVSSHRRTAECFLDHLEESLTPQLHPEWQHRIVSGQGRQTPQPRQRSARGRRASRIPSFPGDRRKGACGA